jgi:oligoendopeptidase F
MGADTGAPNVTWDLTDLYPSVDAPAIDADLNAGLERARAFAARYRGTINVPGGPAPEWVAAALRELEAISELSAKPSIYAELLHAADTRPAAHGALVARTQEKHSEIHNHLVFFDLEWVALEEAAAARVMTAPACARFRHHLEHARAYRPHVLSESEEKILEDTSNVGHRAFSRLFDELVTSLEFEVEIDGERQRLNESGALALLHDARREVRKAAAAAITRTLQQQRVVLTFIFNITAQDHALSDRLRRFPDAMAARNLANEIDGATVGALLDACDGAAGIVADYYRVKRDLLGVDRLYDYDRYAPVASHEGQWSWDGARSLVLEAY